VAAVALLTAAGLLAGFPPADALAPAAPDAVLAETVPAETVPAETLPPAAGPP
jgi:hypothetical protein